MASITPALQWLTLLVFAALALACLMIGQRRALLRPKAAAVFIVAINVVAWYVALLVFPHRLSELATMLWSVATRLHAGFTFALLLWIEARQ